MEVSSAAVGMSLGVVIFYFIIVVLIGVLAWRFFPKATESLAGYATAGKSLGWITMLFSTAAAQYSALFFMGFVAYMYIFGAPLYTAITHMYVLVSAGLWVMFAGRMWKLSRRFGHITPTDAVSQMYGKATGYIFSILMIIALITYMSAQTKGIGWMFWAASYQTIPYEWGAVLAIVVVIIATLLAGQKGTAWVGAMQGFLLLAGVFGGALYFASLHGGVGQVFQHIMSSPDLAKGLTIPGYKPIWNYTYLVPWMIAVGLGWPVHTHMYQKMVSAKSPTISRAYPFIIQATFAPGIFCGFIIAMTAKAFVTLPEGVTPDVAFVYQAMLYFHPIFLGFIAAAGIAAMQSSIDAQALGIATQVTNDFLKGKLSPKGAARVAMAIKLAMAAIAVWVAIASPALILTLGGFAAAFGAVLLPTMFSALTGWKRGNKYAAIISSIVGYLVIFMFDKKLHGGLLPWNHPMGVYSGFWGTLVSFILFFAISLLMPAGRPKEEVLKQYEEVGW